MKASEVFHIDKEFLASDGNQILLFSLFLQRALFSIVSRDFWAGTSTLQSFPQRDPIKPESSLFPGNHCLGEEKEDFNPNSKYQNPGRGGLPSIKARKNKSRICVNKSGGACPGQVNNRLHLLPRAPLHYCTLMYLVLGSVQSVNQFSSVKV